MNDVRTAESQEPSDPTMASKTAPIKVKTNNVASNMRQLQLLTMTDIPRSVHSKSVHPKMTPLQRPTRFIDESLIQSKRLTKQPCSLPSTKSSLTMVKTCPPKSNTKRHSPTGESVQ